MGAPEERSAKLDELDRRIRAAREARAPKRGNTGDKFTAAGMAWRMTLELVVGGMVGAAMGWGLDALFGTLPIFLVVFILLGFAAGIRTVMRSAEELQKKQAAEAAEEKQAAEAAKDEQAAEAAKEKRAAEAAEED
ncbi:MAG: AtpZ/AtpI family protein [Limibaculum sp.]